MTVFAFDATTITGWNIYLNNVDYVGTCAQAAYGVRSLDLDGTYGQAQGGIEQSISTVIGETYTVKFAIAGNDAGGDSIKYIQVSVAGGDHDFTFNTTGKSFAIMGWVYYSFDFTATSTLSNLQFLSTDGTYWWPYLDDISVTAAPMPITARLLGSGLLGLLGWRRFGKN